MKRLFSWCYRHPFTVGTIAMAVGLPAEIALLDHFFPAPARCTCVAVETKA